MPTELRHQAVVAGATVVDRSSVITTHLAEVVREHAGRLLSRQDAKLLLDLVKATDPVVLEEMAAARSPSARCSGCCGGLLDEGVPIRDLVRIIEAVTEQARRQQRTPTACSRRPAWPLGRPSVVVLPPEARCPPSLWLPRSSTPSSRPSSLATTVGPSPSPRLSAEDVVRPAGPDQPRRQEPRDGPRGAVLHPLATRTAALATVPAFPGWPWSVPGRSVRHLPVETIGSVNDEAVALN